jgi:hypothetical protein
MGAVNAAPFFVKPSHLASSPDGFDLPLQRLANRRLGRQLS